MVFYHYIHKLPYYSEEIIDKINAATKVPYLRSYIQGDPPHTIMISDEELELYYNTYWLLYHPYTPRSAMVHFVDSLMEFIIEEF